MSDSPRSNAPRDIEMREQIRAIQLARDLLQLEIAKYERLKAQPVGRDVAFPTKPPNR